MITVAEAKKCINENTGLLPVVAVPLGESGGMILAQDIRSELDVPPFDQSAMDGYAFRFDDLAAGQPLRVVGAIPAGVQTNQPLAAGEAMRIFTGAPVPQDADTVVMQEHVTVAGDQIRIEDPPLKQGGNVRPRGSQTQKGETALPAGAKLTPAAIGFLAGLGVETVSVWAKPRICLLITGNELAPPGSPLQPGQVYESNSFALAAALRELHIQPTLVFRSDDNEARITEYLKTGIETCDLVLVTGGISVGDHDLVKKSLENCLVETVFYKVKQKPGKPLYFGRKANTLLFGLPGNPASVLTCFYEYVVPAIQKMTGKVDPAPSGLTKVLAADFAKKAGLTYFLKGKLDGESVIPLGAQESYRMNSFADADCLIVLEENKSEYRKGETVEVHLLPGA
jgi:molybdopterin molybdotransferase